MIELHEKSPKIMVFWTFAKVENCARDIYFSFPRTDLGWTQGMKTRTPAISFAHS